MPSAEHEAIVELLLLRREEPVGTIEEQREAMDAMAGAMAKAEGTTTQEADADGVPVTWVRVPGCDASRAILYLHGGGYVIGSRYSHTPLASHLAAAAGVPVLLAEYRLAPEHPWPAAVDDAETVWRWMLDQGLDASRGAIAGDSAGGGLTLAVLHRLREAGVALPAGAACLSPWVDLEGTGESATSGAVDDPMIRLDGLREMGRLYAGDDVRAPEASPLHAELGGFPPLLIQVGTRELLLDDARRIAERARAAGVAVTLEEEDGLVHVWQAFAGVPEADAAVERLGRWLRERTGG